MNYLALGDSISIDDYTGVSGGGAAAQFAGLIGATHFQDLTRDGRTTDGVLEVLPQITAKPDVITLTAGGNDFLQSAYLIVNSLSGGASSWNDLPRGPLENLRRIADQLNAFGCPVILNTVYDPTDGNDTLLEAYGVTEGARAAYNTLNGGIRRIGRQYNFLLSDLETLFYSHGAAAADTWIVGQIEPNRAGAAAIARHWFKLYQEHRGK